VPTLERIVVGGMPIAPALMARIERRLGVTVQTSWGMTELSPSGTVARPDDPSRAAELSGRPAVGVDLLLTDADGRALARQRGVEGHLSVRGAAVVERYFGHEEKATDADGWFPTGDLARIDADGSLIITGRSKDLIKSGGEWINPTEIEEIVGRHPDVGQVAVIGDPFDARPILIGNVAIFRTQAIALVVGLVLITAFFLAFRYTDWGVAMRAQAENREAAALMGIRSSRVTATAWLIAGALAGVAVLFMATQDFSGAGLGRGTHAIALIAFPAAIIGGLDSTAGAVVGGIIVGLTESLSAQYISFDFSKSAVFLVMLVVLVVRPSGLFGTKELTRV